MVKINKMKFTTKLKIINLVKQLIRWEDKPIRPFIIEERKVEIAKFYHIYDKKELNWLKEHNGLNRIIKLSIMEEISKTQNAIQYNEEDAHEFGPDKVRVEAFSLFVVPKGIKDINLSQLTKKK
jgi:hypothetical protein